MLKRVYTTLARNVIKHSYSGNTRFTAMPAPKDPQKQTSEDEAAQNVDGPLEKASWFRVAVREGLYVLPAQKPPQGEISHAFAELRILIRYSEGILDAFDKRSRNDPSFIESDILALSVKLCKLHQRGEEIMRHMGFLEELHSRIPLLEGDVEEFNVLSRRFEDLRPRLYKWCKLAARVENTVLVPLHEPKGEHQRVEGVRKNNSEERSRVTWIRFIATVILTLVIGILVFKIR